MSKKGHLPIIGVGPMIVIPQLGLTICGCIFSKMGIIPQIKLGMLKIPCVLFGTFLILVGIYLWIYANFKDHINVGIKNNHLITTGVYALTRNPIYSAFFLVCCGAILWMNNLLLLLIPIICWLYMTIYLQQTEEKWLLDLYGKEYVEYCEKTNRIIPWWHG